MKKIILPILLLLLVISANAQSIAQTRCNNFHKGVNLSNWLEGYWVTDWPDTTTYTFPFFAEMKNAGIQSIRMPVCFALVSDTLPPYAVDTTNRVFRLIDSVIQWTTQLNMNLIINNEHVFNVVDSNWRGQQPRIAHLWAVLANRYKNLDPNRYFFEILNEPANIQNDSLALFYPPIIDTIRQYAPNHSIIVSPTDYSNGIAYLNYQPLPDTNLIYTFHSYDPYEFTNQGLSFDVPLLPTGVPFPNSGFDALLDGNWDAALNWEDSFHLPLFLGEFGVGDSADQVSRCNWMDTMANRIKSHSLSSFYWDVVGDFKWYRSGVVTQDSIFPCFASALGLYGDTTTAIQTITENPAVNIFPNPAQSVLSIETPAGLNNGRYSIMNELGAIVQTGNLNTTKTDVHVSNLANGIYFIQIQTGDETVNRKFVISK
jgi:endoglucanase